MPVATFEKTTGRSAPAKHPKPVGVEPTVAEYMKWKQRNSYYHESLTTLFQSHITPGSRVLELGSGDGDLLAATQPVRGVGIDIDPAMVDFARERHPKQTFCCADAHDFDLQEKFDHIILSNLVGEARDIQTVMQRLHHVCHERTRILIAYYNFLWEPVLRLAQRLGMMRPVPLQNWLGLPDLHNLLDICDFQVIRKQQRILFPKHVPVLSHVLNRFVGVLPCINRLCMVTFIVARPRPAETNSQEKTCSIIIPTKDEKGNIAAAIERTPQMGKHTELIFVDGDSRDGTVEEIERLARQHSDRDIKLLHQDGRGKGDAVRQGFAAATGDVLMILDSDLTMPPEDLPKYFEALTRGRGEFINGSRLVYQLENQSMRFLNIFANKTFAMLFSWLLEQRLKDTLCGTKVLYRSDYQRIAANRTYFGDFDPFGDFDLLFGAAKLNLKIVEIPIRYRARTYGEIKIERFKHGWLLLKMCAVAFKKLKL